MKKKVNKTNIWTFGLNRTEEGVWTRFKGPKLMSFKDSFLKDIGFKKQPMCRIDSISSRSTLYLFQTQITAKCFCEGFSHGQDIERYGDEVWQEMLDAWIDQNKEEKNE